MNPGLKISWKTQNCEVAVCRVVEQTQDGRTLEDRVLSNQTWKSKWYSYKCVFFLAAIIEVVFLLGHL